MGGPTPFVEARPHLLTLVRHALTSPEKRSQFVPSNRGSDSSVETRLNLNLSHFSGEEMTQHSQYCVVRNAKGQEMLEIAKDRLRMGEARASPMVL